MKIKREQEAEKNMFKKRYSDIDIYHVEEKREKNQPTNLPNKLSPKVSFHFIQYYGGISTFQ